jgi:hypothetical protein
MEKEALEQFIRRVAYSRNIKKIDSYGSHGGSPSYFYCKHCGIPTEVFPEPPAFPVREECSQCIFIQENNILEEAKRCANEFFCLGN